jgi:hypothetical protein
MKLIALSLMVVVLGGCSAVSYAIKTSQTKELSVCYDLQGKTVAEAEQVLGKPVGLKMLAEGGQVRRYRKGFFQASLSCQDGVVKEIECKRD